MTCAMCVSFSYVLSVRCILRLVALAGLLCVSPTDGTPDTGLKCNFRGPLHLPKAGLVKGTHLIVSPSGPSRAIVPPISEFGGQFH